MKALQKIGLAALVFGLAACASSKQEAKGEQKPEETTSQPAGQQAPSGSEGTPSPTSPQARAPGAKPERGGQGQGGTARATGSVAEIDAALVSAAANARALETLGKDPNHYDRQSGQRLLDNARQSLNDAKSRAVALRSNASKDDRKQVDELTSRISNAEDSLDRVASRIDRPRDVADHAGKAYSELNAAVKPLKKVARAMGTGIEVVGPTG
jgi:flagellar hook-basal body complex protein FliE